MNRGTTDMAMARTNTPWMVDTSGYASPPAASLSTVASDRQNEGSLVNGLLLGILAMLPMLGLALFWRKHPRSRSRGLAEALGATLLAILIGFYVGPLILGSDGPGAGMTVPMVLGGAVMGMSLNRMARDED